jgi:hypothetical protein
MVEIKTIEDAKEAGLNTSDYAMIDGRYWLNAGDAVLLVSHINNKPLTTNYLSNYIRQDRLHPKRFSPKASLYAFDELVKIRALDAGRPPLSDDQLTDTARRQRKFKDKQRNPTVVSKKERHGFDAERGRSRPKLGGCVAKQTMQRDKGLKEAWNL